MERRNVGRKGGKEKVRRVEVERDRGVQGGKRGRREEGKGRGGSGRGFKKIQIRVNSTRICNPDRKDLEGRSEGRKGGEKKRGGEEVERERGNKEGRREGEGRCF